MTEHHRETDSAIVGHAKAADGALGFLKNWAGVAAMLIGIGVAGERIVGKIDAAEATSNMRFSAIEKSMEDFKNEVREKLKATGTDVNAANTETRAILRADEDNQGAYNSNMNKAMTEIVTILRLKGVQSLPSVPDLPKLGQIQRRQTGGQ